MRYSLRLLKRDLRESARALFDSLLPPTCLGCREPGDPFCGPCRAGLARRGGPACPRCGERVLVAGSPCQVDHRQLAGLSWHVAPYAYRGTGGALVRRFKLDANGAAGDWLARAMAAMACERFGASWRQALLVPVPLHASRRRARGFDQAEWLARAVARRLRCGRVLPVLERQAATLPQGDPRVRSRERNVAAAFAVRMPRPVVGARVVLVDDVFTSGATARTCARLLREAGAAEVALLTACRS